MEFLDAAFSWYREKGYLRTLAMTAWRHPYVPKVYTANKACKEKAKKHEVTVGLAWCGLVKSVNEGHIHMVDVARFECGCGQFRDMLMSCSHTIAVILA
jgi:hypothetical protein